MERAKESHSYFSSLSIDLKNTLGSSVILHWPVLLRYSIGSCPLKLCIQRFFTTVSTSDMVYVSRFVPPENFDLALLTLELEFLRRRLKTNSLMLLSFQPNLRGNTPIRITRYEKKSSFKSYLDKIVSNDH